MSDHGSGPRVMAGDAAQRRELATAAHAAMCAMLFASSESWPAFAAWAGQHVPEVTWGEEDRLAMAGHAAVMARLARHVDGGGPS